MSYFLAARTVPVRSGQANALVWGARYGAFLVGPLLVGVLGDRIGLRATLALSVGTSLAIAWLAYRTAWSCASTLTDREEVGALISREAAAHLRSQAGRGL